MKQSKIPSTMVIPHATFEGLNEFKYHDSKGHEHTIKLNHRSFNKKIEYVWAMINGFPQLVKRSLIDYSKSSNPFVNALSSFKSNH